MKEKYYFLNASPTYSVYTMSRCGPFLTVIPSSRPKTRNQCQTKHGAYVGVTQGQPKKNASNEAERTERRSSNLRQDFQTDRDGKFREPVQHPGAKRRQHRLSWETEAIFTETPLSQR
ncbi:unnamed protein product [Pleuronectes platessa]|uniref:Uncharacterized protein n=1 Tax=Pleuronectes platessa TaxID=8262 RepID=A0A9N7TU60_PLEPL|nr:unnamed protein product [Pleuronectes platessa]